MVWGWGSRLWGAGWAWGFCSWEARLPFSIFLSHLSPTSFPSALTHLQSSPSPQSSEQVELGIWLTSLRAGWGLVLVHLVPVPFCQTAGWSLRAEDSQPPSPGQQLPRSHLTAVDICAPVLETWCDEDTWAAISC